MGQTPLEEKLRHELVSTAELTEARVGGTQYSSLKFHCDWALHSRLDKKEAVKIIKLFDDLEQGVAVPQDLQRAAVEREGSYEPMIALSRRTGRGVVPCTGTEPQECLCDQNDSQDYLRQMGMKFWPILALKMSLGPHLA